MTKYLTVALVACMVALAISMKSCNKIKTDRNRLSDNQRSLFEQAEFYRTKDSLSAASVERLTLSRDEMERHCEQLVETCKDLNVKVRRLQSVSQTAMQSDYHIQIDITTKANRDSTFRSASEKVMSEALSETSEVRKVVYNTPYINLSGVIDGDRFSADITTYDTLVQVVHRVPRKFLFIRYGTKAVRQEVTSKNPHSKITYTEYIELKK